jgi:hypothetical protein
MYDDDARARGSWVLAVVVRLRFVGDGASQGSSAGATTHPASEMKVLQVRGQKAKEKSKEKTRSNGLAGSETDEQTRAANGCR